jgi:hypothetical protein
MGGIDQLAETIKTNMSGKLTLPDIRQYSVTQCEVIPAERHGQGIPTVPLSSSGIAMTAYRFVIARHFLAEFISHSGSGYRYQACELTTVHCQVYPREEVSSWRALGFVTVQFV